MSSYTEGQVHQLANALEAAGFTPNYLTKLGQYRQLGDFRSVLDGRAEIVVCKHIVDLDTVPFVPKGLSVEYHCRDGEFEWDATKVAFHYLCHQEGSNVIEGYELRHEFMRKEVFNANLLDYLFDNPHLIPEEWKGKSVFFWGTIYRDSAGYLFVRYLFWGADRWFQRHRKLNRTWGGNDPALVPAGM